jgi:hypothetical protein
MGCTTSTTVDEEGQRNHPSADPALQRHDSVMSGESIQVEEDHPHFIDLARVELGEEPPIVSGSHTDAKGETPSIRQPVEGNAPPPRTGSEIDPEMGDSITYELVYFPTLPIHEGGESSGHDNGGGQGGTSDQGKDSTGHRRRALAAATGLY